MRKTIPWIGAGVALCVVVIFGVGAYGLIRSAGDVHELPPPSLAIAVPCELVDRVDTSGVVLGEDGNVELLCDKSLYPPPCCNRSTQVFFYIDFVDNSGDHGLRRQTLTGLDEAGLGHEIRTFGLFCDRSIEVAGWGNSPVLDGPSKSPLLDQGLFDPEQITVRC